MKKLITSLTLALVTVCPLAGFGQTDLEKDPAYLPIDKFLDLKVIPPQVNINLPRFLLKDAVAGFVDAEALAKKGNDLSELIKDVKLIRVVVIEANKKNRADLDKAVKKLRTELDAKWTTVVSIPEEHVGVYAMGDPSGDSTAGVAVLVNDGGDVVIGNVVGHVSIAKIIQIANKLPKDFWKQWQDAGKQSMLKPTAKGEKTADGATTDKPAEAPETPIKAPTAE
jgi:hypothetical protein